MRQLLGTVVILALGVQLSAQERSIRERVREYGDLEILENGCGPLRTLPEVVARNQLLVHGVVESVGSRLTADERTVVTDVAIRPFEVLHSDGRQARLGAVVLNTRGGEVMVEGHRVLHRVHSNGAGIQLQAGQEVVILASATQNNGSATFYADGVFTVEHGHVSPVVRFERWASDPSTDAFLAEVRQLFERGRR